jgi:phage repressor protein C with HTH and peptisase S24 domain
MGGAVHAVLVEGPSMLPTLRSGDCLLVRAGAPVRPGDLVVARPWTRPELLVVKRAVEPVAGGWLVASDNPAVAGQGWTGGEADVLATVLLRYWPPSGWGRPARRVA